MAVGFPATAYFAILEWSDLTTCWQADLHHVSYDPEALRKEVVNSGLLEISPLGQLLMDTSLTGKNVGANFMRYAFALAKEACYAELPYVPDDVWDQAAATYHDKV
jgi:hypothetical protein